MPTKEKILNFLSENKKEFKDNFNITKIGLFGSFANGEINENSDIDIIIELEENTDNIFGIKQKLRKKIQDEFNIDVDIARERYLKPYVKGEILGKAIYV